MNKARYYLNVCVVMVLVAGNATGQEKAAPTISGFIDSTYTYNFNRPPSGITALRSFDANDNTFSLNAIQLNFQGNLEENVGYVIETTIGADASAITSAGAGAGAPDDFDIQEGYLKFKCHSDSAVTFTAGKFVTLEGIEVIESGANPTISRGHLFGLAEPFAHTGLKADWSGDVLSFTLGAVNGWDRFRDNNSGKTGLGRIGFNFGNPLSFGVVGYIGPEKAGINGDARTSLDLVGVTKPSEKLAIWFQANTGTEEKIFDGVTTEDRTWSGFTIQPVLTLSDSWSLGARYEYFDETDGYSPGTGVMIPHVVNNITVTPTYKINDATTLRLEYRNDVSNKKVFEDDKGLFSKDNNSTASLEFIYTF